MAIQSAYNVVVPLDGARDGGWYALFNPLAGSLDVIDEVVARGLSTLGGNNGERLVSLRSGSAKAKPTLAASVEQYLDRRGYLFESADEERRQSRILYEEMLSFHRRSVRQPLVVIPTYKCDLRCSYCWQRLYRLDSPVMDDETLRGLFGALPSFVEIESPERVDLVLFGGEPLQDIPELRAVVVRVLRWGREQGFSTKVITNGVGLAGAMPSLEGLVDVVQVTLDGPPEVHRRRRPLPGGDSFTPAAAGIDRAAAAGIRVNVRVNVAEANLPRLPELADVARQAGWLESGNVVLHLAPVKNHNPKKSTPEESTLLDQVLELVESDSRMEVFDLSGFPGIKYFTGFKESGLFSLHRFFNCEAQMNFYAFDLFGDIYPCWDSAGIRSLAIGRFLPEIEIDPERLAQWRKRTSLDITECGGCPSSPHCGGGCQFLSFEHTGRFDAPSCDSILAGYERSIQAHSEWLVERAREGDHAVGLVAGGAVVHPVLHQFGLLEREAVSSPPLSCE